MRQVHAKTGDGWRAPKSPEMPPLPPPMIWHLYGPAEATARHFAHPCLQRQYAGDELGGSLVTGRRRVICGLGNRTTCGPHRDVHPPNP